MTFNFSQSDIDRFLTYCSFDPTTGCVIWEGGKSRGKGKHAWYGSFWCDGRTRRAHIFAAVAIHGISLQPGHHVDHFCTHSLCVRHLKLRTSYENLALVNIRRQVGLEEMPSPDLEENGVPFYLPPNWLPEPRIIIEKYDKFGHAREDTVDCALPPWYTVLTDKE